MFGETQIKETMFGETGAKETMFGETIYRGLGCKPRMAHTKVVGLKSQLVQAKTSTTTGVPTCHLRPDLLANHRERIYLLAKH